MARFHVDNRMTNAQRDSATKPDWLSTSRVMDRAGERHRSVDRDVDDL